MKYVNGYNILLSAGSDLPINYSSLGISSNFLSNVNVMLIVAVLFPIIGGCILLIVCCSKEKR